MGTAGVTEATAKDQRIRLIGGMIEAVAEDGYARVSIEKLVRIAGISKSAFYIHFGGKDECFLATVDEILRLAMERTSGAYHSESDVRTALEAAIGATIDNAVAYTDAARLVVVDSIELGRGSVEVRERIAALLEATILDLLGGGKARAQLSDLTIRAVVGGMRGVLFIFLRDRRPERMRKHVADLARWEMTYVEAAENGGASIGVELVAEATRMRPGRGADGGAGLGWDESPKSDASRSSLGQRERIMRGAARMAAQKSYRAISVPTISADAGTSNQTFYSHFRNKEEAVLAAFDAVASAAVARSGWAHERRDDWRSWAATSVVAMLDVVASDPLLVDLFLFELPSIGPAAVERAFGALRPFTAFLAPGTLPAGATRLPPPVVVSALTAGIWRIVEHEVINDRAASLPDLAPEILEIALTPFGLER